MLYKTRKDDWFQTGYLISWNTLATNIQATTNKFKKTKNSRNGDEKRKSTEKKKLKES